MERRFVTRCLVIAVLQGMTLLHIHTLQGWKSETTQENDNSRQVQPLGSTRKTETLQARCWEDPELHANYHVLWKTRWRFCGARIRMYEQQKIKSSLTLLPDKHSAEEHVKQPNLQAYIWKQCVLKDINYPNPEECGWQVEEMPCASLVPLLPVSTKSIM